MARTRTWTSTWTCGSPTTRPRSITPPTSTPTRPPTTRCHQSKANVSFLTMELPIQLAGELNSFILQFEKTNKKTFCIKQITHFSRSK